MTNRLKDQLERYETKYGMYDATKPNHGLRARFENLIREAYYQTGQKTVVLVDEYKKPLLETINNHNLQQY